LIETSANSSITIGVLTDWINPPYQAAILSGIADYAFEKNINFFCFAAGRLNSLYEWEKNRNIFFDFITKKNMDGIIIFAPTLRNLLSKEEFEEILKKLPPIPKLTIEEEYADIPAILVDNEKGMTDLMNHLIESHGYKNLAFISGPKGNEEANIRFRIFLKSLEAHHIPYNSDLTVIGNFLFSSGKSAITTLLDERNVKIDAIVASNDDMAAGALEELLRRGRTGFDNIPIVGFDDTQFSQDAKLTTVKQPLYEQGRKAAELMVQQIKGENIPPVVGLSTELIIRESCGCFFHHVQRIAADLRSIQPTEDPIDALLSNKEEILQSILATYQQNKKNPNKSWRNWTKILFESLIKNLKEEKNSIFLLTWNNIAKEEWANERNVRNLQHFLSVFRAFVTPYLADKKILLQAEDLLHEARIMLSSSDDGIFQKIYKERKGEKINQISGKLAVSLSIEEQMDVLSEELPSLGINECYLALYENPRKPLENSKLIFGLRKGERINLQRKEIVFPTKEILPQEIMENVGAFAFIAQDLYERDEQIGFVLFDASAKDWKISETLRIQINIALARGLLIDQIRNQAKILEEQVKERTANLSRTNAQLELEIVEKRRAEEMLKKSEERYKEMALLLPSIILETDLNFRITFVNNTGLEILGFAVEDIKKGLSFLEFVHPDEKEKLQEYFSKIIDKELINFIELRVQRPDGKIFTLLIKGNPVYRGYTIEGIRWNALDIKPMLINSLLPDSTFFKERHVSPREEEVILLLMKGYRPKEIADALFISEGTVKDHLTSVYQKMGVSTRNEFFNLMKTFQINRFGYQSYVFSLITEIIKS
jgi:PAS domain S-box-containing protein